MKRFIGYALAAFFIFGSAQAFAQSAVWTGDYYVVVGMNEKAEYALTYGYPLEWQGLRAGPNLEGATLADVTLAPIRARSDERHSGRYELLAVGNKDGQAYTATGYEWANEPRFPDNGIETLDGLTSASSAAWTGAHYVVLGRAMGGDGVRPTPRDAVAFGFPGAWEIVNLPFNEELNFTHLAVGAMRDPTLSVPVPYEMLAVGTHRNGSAFAMVGYEFQGLPLFSGVPIRLPEITQPTSVEWSGVGYVVSGQNDRGDVTVLYGFPDRWDRAKDINLVRGEFTSLIVAPTDAGYDLLALGTIRNRAVSRSGEQIGEVPIFDDEWLMIPELYGVGQATVPGDDRAGANALSVPYPNPFNPEASFNVTVAADQSVRIEVFNMLGQRAAVIHNGVLTRGRVHTFTFDGGALPSGTYTLRAKGEDFVQTRQLNLLK